MTQSPAVIIIVRHGARLDAADSTWHLSSPTPYDPPLTYGGWTQSRALGARIASLLVAREHAFDADGIDEDDQTMHHPHKLNNRKRKRHKVIIHTSPFLRCLQTSIGISSGLSRYLQRGKGAPPSPTSAVTQRSISRLHDEHDLSPFIQKSDTESQPALPQPSSTHGNLEKTILRIDPFLGEWLAPDYFEAITPPPSSAMMMASAKAELLRTSEPIPNAYVTFGSRGHFPGGWSKGKGIALSGSKDDDPMQSLSSLSSALPHLRRERSSSYSSVASATSLRSGSQGSSFSTPRREHVGYVAPIPNYAVSSADPIPTGYVDHARDACSDVDFSWDSMREPQNWPSGGELGEEWSSMHKRFRKGIDDLIKWYKTHGILSPKSDSSEHHHFQEDELDKDTDLVIVLVTHGAGCNALIGALTNHPALLDVGMASLTVAVRKDYPQTLSLSIAGDITSSPPPSRRNSVDLGLSDDYDMRIVASLDHLRHGFESKNPPIAVVPPIPEYKRGSTDSAIEHQVHERLEPTNSALGSMRRSSHSGSSKSYAGGRPGLIKTKTSLGLWGAQQSPNPEAIDVDGSPAVAEVDDDLLTPLSGQAQRTINQFGLWGGANVSGSKNERVMAPKRRWTVSEPDS